MIAYKDDAGVNCSAWDWESKLGLRLWRQLWGWEYSSCQPDQKPAASTGELVSETGESIAGECIIAGGVQHCGVVDVVDEKRRGGQTSAAMSCSVTDGSRMACWMASGDASGCAGGLCMRQENISGWLVWLRCGSVNDSRKPA